MAVDTVSKVQSSITELLKQVDAAKESASSDSPHVKAGKQVGRTAQILRDALSYFAEDGTVEGSDLTAEDGDRIRKDLEKVATRLSTHAEQIAPASTFDRTRGNELSGVLKIAVQMGEAGMLDEEIAKSAAEAVAAWSGVKGSGGGGGPRAAKGQGGLGYVVTIAHPSFDKPLSDSTGIGSAMSSALGKLGKLQDPQIASAARKSWADAGKEDVYDTLHTALKAVVKDGQPGDEQGQWVVNREGAAPESAAA